MAYEEIGSVDVVVLGGVDKTTGRKNPTELEGYLVEIQQRPNKFNPNQPQNFYVFQTQAGLKGVYAKAGINSVLKGAQLGAMTKLVATGETLDTGKGNPMKVFKGFQDKKNTIDVTTVQLTTTDDTESYESEEAEVEADEPVLPPPARPARAAAAPSAANQAAVQALLSGARSKVSR